MTSTFLSRRQAPATATAHAVRLDIQVLRAVAVGIVVLYHLWPTRLPGGFVGVDVFFVISGFLITSHLLKQAESDTGIKLFRFWGKRALRLLPMACLVLLATVWAVLLWLPQSSWKPALRGIVGSALYVQNWLLAGDSVNYLARDERPLPTQHFWSLSTEEQFYIVWPIMLLIATFLAVRFVGRAAGPRQRRAAIRRGVGIAIALVAVISFAYSLWLTFNSPGLAYFATTTRAWEFAAGGLISFVLLKSPSWLNGRIGRLVRIAASWIAYLVLLGTALWLPASAPFPGFAALLPVVATALAIWAGDLRWAVAPTLLARVRPVTYLGDISYGIYLWHWPIIVVLPFVTGGALTTPQRLGVLLVTILLASASKHLVEDPVRFGTMWTQPARRAFYPALAGMLAVCMVAGLAIVTIDRSAIAAPANAAAASGAGSPVLVPSIATRGEDRANMYDCFDFDKSGPHICSYGPSDAPVSIAITGDSHAAHLIPALTDIVERNGWSLTTYVGMGCDAALAPDCGGGQKQLDAIVAGHYDLVLISAYRASTASEDGVEEYWQALTDAGVPLLPVADVPYNTQAAFDCIDASGGDPVAAKLCTIPAQNALVDIPDRVTAIAAKMGLPLADLTDLYCDPNVCQTVIDNVIVYQDSPSSHLTATFSRKLAPRLESEIKKTLAAR